MYLQTAVFYYKIDKMEKDNYERNINYGKT